eukprot:15366294-Ditylum_brightwellii.AAC.1
MFGTVAVYVLRNELMVIQSKQKNGMLRPLNCVMTKSILTLYFVFVCALFAPDIPGWALQNYPITSFVEVVVLWSPIVYLYEAFVKCVAVWVKNKIVGKDATEALHNILPIFVDEDIMAKDIYILLLMTLPFKNLYLLCVIVRGCEISTPKS